jgi:hypothetical protein
VSAIPSWWEYLNHGGLLIGPGQLEEHFLGTLPPLSEGLAEKLRRAVTRIEEGDAALGPLLDTVLEDVLGLESHFWDKNPGTAWSHAAITKERIRPRRVWTGPNGATLPVFDTRCFVGPTGGQKPPRIGIGRGRQIVSRVVEWLRQSGRSKVALLTTGSQWRLIHAGENYDAWCEWDTTLWFAAGQPGPQVEALRHLLGRDAVTPAASGERCRLETAILDSRRGEADLSSALGERARQAVEKLIQSLAPVLDRLAAGEKRETYNDVYLAATRLVMRCVVILFAEGRELLPLSEPVYHGSYGIQGLREQLEHAAEDTLRESHSAWPRLVALFHLLYEGSDHGQFPVVSYGGRLFEPGDSNSNKPVDHAIAAFEASDAPSDLDVKEILALLTKTYAKLRQRRGARPFPVPVDFSAMDTEYIGILYEGLLAFNLKRVGDDPIIILRMGDYPVLPWSRLREMQDKDLEALLGKLKQKSKLQVSEDEEEENEDEDDSAADESETEAESEIVEEQTPLSVADALHAEVFEFAVKAVKMAKIVKAIRGKKTPQRLKEYEEEARSRARQVFDIKRPDEWYLVRFGNTRKGSGTFYTRPQLAAPTVRRTLQPLCLLPDGTPRKPDEILALKICDPAMGSGSFLISALRYLTEKLLASLYHYDCVGKRPGEWICRIADGWKAERITDETAPVPAAQPDAEERLEARLRRYVVERCLYGVDIDELAVELGRMALWIETIDRELPFGFLDHKIKTGNSLVGCWFDRFEDYPATAWLREGGDKDHKAIDKSRPNWTKAIAARLKVQVKPNLLKYIAFNKQSSFEFVQDARTPAQVHDEAMRLLEQMHELPVHEVEERRKLYDQIQADPSFQRLKLAFDSWCALWFWPGDRLDTAPLPTAFVAPPEVALSEVCRLRNLGGMYQFFHWELEFPDVFGGERAGFDAVVGNPPWEVQKPNSREFFSNLDPLYRGYGKAEAEAKQKALFKADSRIENDWLSERARLKALANWVRHVGQPFGDYTHLKKDGEEEWIFAVGNRFADSARLHRQWQSLRHDRIGYADADHIFRHQGSADLNSYKMFLEAAYRLLKSDGRLGFLLPSGMYSDKGSTQLRELVLNQSRWEWLFGFENRDGIFDIHRSFKFAPIVVQKGNRTDIIQTAFMRRLAADWEDAEKHSMAYPLDRVVRFSPFSKAIVEIRSERDLSVFEKAYSNGALLGSGTPRSWNITCKREFHMTDDVRSGAFQRLSTVEGAGFVRDLFGNWLRGGWRTAKPQEGPGVVPSADSLRSIDLADIEDVALPVYQGVMIAPLLPSAATYMSTAANRGDWAVPARLSEATSSQFLMLASVYHASRKRIPGVRLLYRVQARTTDARTTIASLVEGCPFGHSLNAITVRQYDLASQIAFGGLFVSFAHDWLIRQRIGGANLSIFYLFESACPDPTDKRIPKVSSVVARLNLIQPRNSGTWLQLRAQLGDEVVASRARLALTPHERLRLRCVLDAAVADIYGLSDGDFRRILQDCDYPVHNIKDDDFSRSLDPKGFWRVDKEEPPELRHTVLSLVAFRDLQAMGFDRFINEWELPDSLRLADYDLGRDNRAQEAQPVASILGPRLLEWQTAQTAAESWEECAQRAEWLEKIIPTAPPDGDPEESETDDAGQIPISYTE